MPECRACRTQTTGHGETTTIKKGSVMHVLRVGLLVLLGALLTGCGYNRLQQQDEQVTAAWSEVLNQYQRRADLVPNLVNTVKGAVAAEKDILDSVVEARAK